MSKTIRMPALDPSTLPTRQGSRYPEQFRAPVLARTKKVLGDPLGITHFGVNLVTLPPGAWSSQRHYHFREDEFIYVVEGEITLVTDEGEQTLGPGKCAGFPAGKPDGHHIVNRSDRVAIFLEVGDRVPGDECVYSDVDMELRIRDGKEVFVRKNGEPYED